MSKTALCLLYSCSLEDREAAITILEKYGFLPEVTDLKTTSFPPTEGPQHDLWVSFGPVAATVASQAKGPGHPRLLQLPRLENLVGPLQTPESREEAHELLLRASQTIVAPPQEPLPISISAEATPDLTIQEVRRAKQERPFLHLWKCPLQDGSGRVLLVSEAPMPDQLEPHESWISFDELLLLVEASKLLGLKRLELIEKGERNSNGKDGNSED